jgi:hypothetical protein
MECNKVCCEMLKIDDFIHTLPIIPHDYNLINFNPQESSTGRIEFSINYKERFNKLSNHFGGIFDAACIGQYLGGIDTFHNKGCTDGFLNTHSGFRVCESQLEWRKIDNKYILFIKCKNDFVPVYNLHIHNKSLERFLSNKETMNGSSNIEKIKNIKY